MNSSPNFTRPAEPSLPSTSVAGVKRPAPSLLPPFEPLSSSPGLPRFAKKRRVSSAPNVRKNYSKYPTPVPTSSTGILSSSPPHQHRPQQHHHMGTTRPSAPLPRSQSSGTERAPLCAVPAAELKENGETLLMGRSSNSSHFQLSANRLISRVHVKARYVPATEPLEPNRVEIVCCGWNGLKLHCQGRTWDLSKGDTFTSETENTEIMLDVQDARVRIQWPRKDRPDLLGNLSDSSWDESPRSATHPPRLPRNGAAPGTPGAPGASALQSSPLRRTHIASPESPTPVGVPASGASLQALLSQQLGSGDSDEDEVGPNDNGGAIQIYEDASADELELPKQATAAADASFATDVMDSNFSSELSEIPSDDDNEDHSPDSPDSQENADLEDPDEENDPIIHSFGPFGANLSDRLASITASSPKIERKRLSRIPSEDGSLTSAESGRESSTTVAKAKAAQAAKPACAPPHRSTSPQPRKQQRNFGGVGLGISVTDAAATNAKDVQSTAAPTTPTAAAAPRFTPEPAPVPVISSNVDVDTVRNHLINQLAFSRLSSSPLSTILSNLPAEERRDLTREGLRHIIEGTKCVGVILRQGKDAAGQPLESEYYYVADLDEDLSRKAVVDGLRKPSLRNCRKQHKQYYWKKPRTP